MSAVDFTERSATLVKTSPGCVRISGLIGQSIVDGPGLRMVLFAQGCPHACPGCQNPDTHDYAGGYECKVAEIVDAFDKNPILSGITLSGGDPFVRPGELLPVAQAVRQRGKSVWCYTGYTFEELMDRSVYDADTRELCARIDVLVDGRFVEAKRTLEARFRGSYNQRLIDMPRSLRAGAPRLFELSE